MCAYVCVLLLLLLCVCVSVCVFVCVCDVRLQGFVEAMATHVYSGRFGTFLLDSDKCVLPSPSPAAARLLCKAAYLTRVFAWLN